MGTASVYGSQAYWEERYEAGPVGASDTKGELSNEWYLLKSPDHTIDLFQIFIKPYWMRVVFNSLERNKAVFWA